MTIDLHGSLEEAVFRALNRDCGQLVDAIAVTLSARWFGVLVAVALVCAAGLRWPERRREIVVSFALAVVASDLLGAQLLRPWIGRMRPCFALPAGTVRWLAPASDVGSLPSLHASNFFALAWVAWRTERRVGLVALAIAALVAWSRIYVGVHWPTDVLAGALWGALCAIAAVAIAKRIVAPRERSGTTA